MGLRDFFLERGKRFLAWTRMNRTVHKGYCGLTFFQGQLLHNQRGGEFGSGFSMAFG